MGQTEKYYRKYRKYKKQYLYYKQYLVGGGEAATKRNLATTTQSANAAVKSAVQEENASDETDLKQAEVAAAEGQLNQTVNTEAGVQEEVAVHEEQTATTEKELAAVLNKEADMTAEQKSTNAQAAALLLQEKGIHEQILAIFKHTLEKSEEAKSYAIQAKGDIKELSTECEELARQIKNTVSENENVKKALNMAKTHKKGADNIYELSSGAKRVEGTVIGLVNRTMGQDGKKGVELYNKCKKYIHHSVGLYVNEDKHLEKEEAELKKLETKGTEVEEADVKGTEAGLKETAAAARA